MHLRIIWTIVFIILFMTTFCYDWLDELFEQIIDELTQNKSIKNLYEQLLIIDMNSFLLDLF